MAFTVAGLACLDFGAVFVRVFRGYDAVGSEYFAAAFIAMFVFFIFEKAREWLWTRR